MHSGSQSGPSTPRRAKRGGERAEPAALGFGVGVDVRDQRETQPDHGRVHHPVVRAVYLGAPGQEQGDQDDALQGLGEDRAADGGAEGDGDRAAGVRPQFRDRDHPGVQRPAEQRGHRGDPRARAEHRGEQRPRLGLQPVQVQDGRQHHGDREQREEQPGQRRDRAAADERDQRHDGDEAAGPEHHEESQRRAAEPPRIENRPRRRCCHAGKVTCPFPWFQSAY